MPTAVFSCPAVLWARAVDGLAKCLIVHPGPFGVVAKWRGEMVKWEPQTIWEGEHIDSEVAVTVEGVEASVDSDVLLHQSLVCSDRLSKQSTVLQWCQEGSVQGVAWGAPFKLNAQLLACLQESVGEV